MPPVPLSQSDAPMARLIQELCSKSVAHSGTEEAAGTNSGRDVHEAEHHNGGNGIRAVRGGADTNADEEDAGCGEPGEDRYE